MLPCMQRRHVLVPVYGYKICHMHSRVMLAWCPERPPQENTRNKLGCPVQEGSSRVQHQPQTSGISLFMRAMQDASSIAHVRHRCMTTHSSTYRHWVQLRTCPVLAIALMRAVRFMTFPRYAMRPVVPWTSALTSPMSMPTCNMMVGGR